MRKRIAIMGSCWIGALDWALRDEVPITRREILIEGHFWATLEYHIRQAYNYSHCLGTCEEHTPMGYAHKNEISNIPSQP